MSLHFRETVKSVIIGHPPISVKTATKESHAKPGPMPSQTSILALSDTLPVGIAHRNNHNGWASSTNADGLAGIGYFQLANSASLRPVVLSG